MNKGNNDQAPPENPMVNKTFAVTCIETPPYTMLKLDVSNSYYICNITYFYAKACISLSFMIKILFFITEKSANWQ
jgi:hypothetical protein